MDDAMVSGSGPAVRAVALDDRDAFAAWVRPHWAGLIQLARRLSPTGEWEDVLQDALAAAWRKRAQFDTERGTARNWLLAIVADQARKGHRRASRRIVRSVVEPHVDDVADPDLERALTGLTVRQRTAVVLHYYLGLPVADVAEVMTCAVGTVKSTLSDARARLRRELGEDYR